MSLFTFDLNFTVKSRYNYHRSLIEYQVIVDVTFRDKNERKENCKDNIRHLKK